MLCNGQFILVSEDHSTLANFTSNNGGTPNVPYYLGTANLMNMKKNFNYFNVS